MKTDKKTSKKFQNKLVVKSRTENLTRIRDFIYLNASAVGFSNDVIDNIILAVDEACTNIIKHAYKLSPDGDIVINVKNSAKKFTIELTDYGISFDPDKVPDPDLQKYYMQHKVGGLGMYLMKTLIDEVKYICHPGEYNQVLLSMYLNRADKK